MLMGSITESGHFLYRRRFGTCGRTSAKWSSQRIVQTGKLPNNIRGIVKFDMAGISAQTRTGLELVAQLCFADNSELSSLMWSLEMSSRRKRTRRLTASEIHALFATANVGGAWGVGLVDTRGKKLARAMSGEYTARSTRGRA